jgi:hypothetical protein
LRTVSEKEAGTELAQSYLENCPALNSSEQCPVGIKLAILKAVIYSPPKNSFTKMSFLIEFK